MSFNKRFSPYAVNNARPASSSSGRNNSRSGGGGGGGYATRVDDEVQELFTPGTMQAAPPPEMVTMPRDTWEMVKSQFATGRAQASYGASPMHTAPTHYQIPPVMGYGSAAPAASYTNPSAIHGPYPGHAVQPGPVSYAPPASGNATAFSAPQAGEVGFHDAVKAACQKNKFGTACTKHVMHEELETTDFQSKLKRAMFKPMQEIAQEAIVDSIPTIMSQVKDVVDLAIAKHFSSGAAGPAAGGAGGAIGGGGAGPAAGGAGGAIGGGGAGPAAGAGGGMFMFGAPPPAPPAGGAGGAAGGGAAIPHASPGAHAQAQAHGIPPALAYRLMDMNGRVLKGAALNAKIQEIQAEMMAMGGPAP